MPSLLETYNPSILAIPAYYILSVFPHGYALNIATQGKLGTWDNRNPRSTDLKAKLKERLPTETFAKYERLEACHANGMENLPLFASAVVLGNLAGLKKGELTTFVASFLAIRIAYTAVYATHQTQGPTLIRTGLWNAGVLLCFRTIIKAARALGGTRV
ncbi:Nn.00g016890.m01.CDS01 [Neocucurbitaria sp. VM-36]